MIQPNRNLEDTSKTEREGGMRNLTEFGRVENFVRRMIDRRAKRLLGSTAAGTFTNETGTTTAHTVHAENGSLVVLRETPDDAHQVVTTISISGADKQISASQHDISLLPVDGETPRPVAAKELGLYAVWETLGRAQGLQAVEQAELVAVG